MSKIASTDQAYFGRDLEAMSFAVNYHRWIAGQLRPFLGRRVVEAGAGSGNFTEMLLEAGPEHITALEPSENMFPLLRRRWEGDDRVTCMQSFFGDAAPKLAGNCDSVVYVNVMEHVEDDAGELRMAWEALPAGGHVCIYVPALPALFSAFDRAVGHHRRYTRATLRERLLGAGFEISRLTYCDFLGIVPWYLAFTLGGKILQGGHVSTYDRWVVPLACRLEGLVPPPIGKNLLAIGRKPAA